MAVLLELLDPEEEVITFLRNVDNHLSDDSAQKAFTVINMTVGTSNIAQ
jgi:hypothetical protein